MTAAHLLAAQLSEGDARRLTQQIQLLTGSIADQVDRVTTLIAQAEVGRAWEALGYLSWTAYCGQEFAGALPRLDSQARQELAGSLAEAGMSSRSIAPIVGVSDRQIRRDISGGTSVPPEPPVTWEPVDPDAEIVDAELIDDGPSAPKPITGMDGKNYNRPEPRPSKPAARRSLVDYARDTAEQLRRVTNRLESIAADDRLSRNKEMVVARLQYELDRSGRVQQELLAQLKATKRPLLDPAELVADPAELAQILELGDASDEVFEQALKEARDEGDLSRENIIRKITELKQEPVP